jgi:hypothetical protein
VDTPIDMVADAGNRSRSGRLQSWRRPAGETSKCIDTPYT